MTARVSLTMIVKNEAATLAHCLSSVRDLVDEMIVVDTGSSDNSKDIAKQHGACVFELPWPDSFAVARNESICHAAGQWLLWLDADEHIDEPNRAKLRSLLANLQDDNASYVMRQRSAAASGSAILADHVRLFRNHPAIRWDYRVHEQIPPSLCKAGHIVRATDIVIEHSGYLDAGQARGKLERNLRLLRLDVADRPNDPFVLFNLGWTLTNLDHWSEAVPLLQRGLQHAHPVYFLTPKLYALLARCHRSLDQLAEAWAVSQAGHVRYPHDTELLFLKELLQGQLCHQRGDNAAARRCWTQLLEDRSPTVAAPAADGIFRSIDTGVCGPLARQHLAWLDFDEGRFADAENHWRTILADMPTCTPARLGLAELYLQQKRWSELVDLLNELEPHAPQQAAGFRARMNRASHDFTAPLPEAIAAEQVECLPPDAGLMFTVIVAADVSE
ncbi:MAG TPA: glycosyltransferase [Gemmataceae bacterium]|nr:glycosyltransferase [Gemmataceae bacterium]